MKTIIMNLKKGFIVALLLIIASLSANSVTQELYTYYSSGGNLAQVSSSRLRPSGLSAQPGSCGGEIVVSWDPTSATTYDLAIIPGPIEQYGLTSTSFNHSGLTPGATYTYKVRGVKGKKVSDWTSTVTGVASAPCLPSVTLTASPDTITQGNSSTLSWNSTYVTSCSASGAWSNISATSGSQEVTPSITSTYTLDCAGPGGSVSQSTTVNVTVPPPPPPTSGFNIGDTVQTTSNVNVRTASGGTIGSIIGTQNAGSLGSVVAGPILAKDGAYFWSVDYVNSPDGWSAENFLQKTTGTPPPPSNTPTVSLSASPSSIVSGGSSTLSWNSSNATSCTASGGWAGAKSLSGTYSATPNTTTTYNLSCTGTGGTTNKSVTVGIASAPGPINPPIMPLIFQVPMPTQTGKVWSIAAGDSAGFQSALNQAQLGDTIELQAGATYNGSFTFPNKTQGSGWIVVRSSAHASLPASGMRVQPGDAGNMPKLVSPGSNKPTIIFAPGSHHYRLIGLDVTLPTTITYIHNTIVSISPASGNIADLPNNITLDRMYIHAQPTNGLQRCVHADGSYVAIVDSYLGECHAKGFDSQAIIAFNTNGPLKIVNNHLEGAGENILFGGADPAINGAIPSDIEIKGNYFYTPVAWKGTKVGNTGTTLWTKKNLFESKSSKRVLMEGNVFDGSWSDGQVGHAFVIKTANQSGKCTWCQTTDYTIRYNVIKNIGGTGGVSGDSGSNNYPIGGRTSRVVFEHNIFENINVQPYEGVARLIELYNNAQDVVYRNNTWNTTGYIQHFISAGNSPTATNFEYKDNIAPFGQYGIVPGYGEAGLANVVNGSFNYSGNVVYGAKSFPSTKYPLTTSVATYADALNSGTGANQTVVRAATAKAITGR